MPSKYDTTESRREELPGYPVELKFTDPEKLKAYFAGEKITCLRCGKKYRTLGVHLKTIHGMEPDEYREIYGIPWTKGLSCSETTGLHADDAKEKIASGIFTPSADQAALARLTLQEQRPRQPVRDTYSNKNLEKMNEGKTGEDAMRRRNAAKQGSPEHREKMRQLGKGRAKEVGERLGGYWRGREQTDEHVLKRTGYHKKT